MNGSLHQVVVAENVAVDSVEAEEEEAATIANVVSLIILFPVSHLELLLSLLRQR